MLENKREVSHSAALEKAAMFFGVSATRVKSMGLTQSGAIPAFQFEIDGRFIQVTQYGGYILNYFTSRPAVAAGTDDYARDIPALISSAKKFLNERIDCRGAEFDEIQHFTDGGVLIIDFGGLIKIGVALDDSEILFYCAGNYLKYYSVQVGDAA